jgi:putative transcriptional regulator
MTTHHPSDETLLRYAAGKLAAGPALVVAVHLDGCAVCRARVGEYEAIGGHLLETMPSEQISSGSLIRTLELLETDRPAPRRPSTPRRDIGTELPGKLRRYEIGPWRWLAPGFRWSRIAIPGERDAKVMLLRARAGLKLPKHGHTGTEYMQVLFGSLSDDRGRYGPGDFDEADAEVEHRPIVGWDSECICLAALDGDTRLRGLLGRMLRPIVGF